MKHNILPILLAIPAIMVSSCGVQKNVVHYEDESIDIGYGQMSSQEKTSAHSKVKPGENETINYSNMMDYLRGRVPGLNVDADGSITIRGINTLNGDPTPLFIVDGVAVPSIDTINPYDVKSVDVIKDGSSAIYGVRGANGVIIINLKK